MTILSASDFTPRVLSRTAGGVLASFDPALSRSHDGGPSAPPAATPKTPTGE